MVDSINSKAKGKLILTGGGTGGHVFPALSIAEALRDRGFEILYVGSPHGLENKLVPPKGFPLYTVKTGQVKNQGVFKILKTFFQLLFAILWAIRFLRRHRPLAVVGVGGYVSVPMCVAGFLSGIPVYLQEQNASVGIANRFLGKLARKIFLGFEGAKQYFRADKCVVSGNPVRKEFLKESPLPMTPNKSLLVFGGSQGARAINNAVADVLQKIKSDFPDVKILHQTGEADFERIKAVYADKFGAHGEVKPFINDMLSAYRNASLVISRSGALTVSELICVGRPSILVPLPRKGQNDQTANAQMMEKAGAAKVVEQGENFEARLWSALKETFNAAELSRMSGNFSALRGSDALATIAAHIEQDLGMRVSASSNVQ